MASQGGRTGRYGQQDRDNLLLGTSFLYRNVTCSSCTEAPCTEFCTDVICTPTSSGSKAGHSHLVSEDVGHSREAVSGAGRRRCKPHTCNYLSVTPLTSSPVCEASCEARKDNRGVKDLPIVAVHNNLSLSRCLSVIVAKSCIECEAEAGKRKGMCHDSYSMLS